MLTEKRYEVILNLLNEKNSVTVTEIKELLGISESTIRRDLAALDKAGKLIKVFGGAVAADGGFTTAEPSVAQKAEINKDEKTAIARYAASLIERDDFVYLDAGTTTGQMIDFIKEKSATFVTNAVSHAQRLAAQGYRVYLIGGELKGTTEAVVGNQAILSLQKLHFSKAFLGTNGVGLKAGFSTPDYSEADGGRTGETDFCAGGSFEVRECEFGDVCGAGLWSDPYGSEAAGEFWVGEEH